MARPPREHSPLVATNPAARDYKNIHGRPEAGYERQCSREGETRRRAAGTPSDNPTVSRIALIRPLAGFCCGLAVLTIFWPDWIEALTGYDPDQHDGTVEWLILIALLSSAPYWRSQRGRARRPPL
jgi:hypothetical protein